MKRAFSFPVIALVLFLCAFASSAALGEGFPVGEWAFNHAPEESVLLLREDGTAVLKGQAFTWADDGAFLRLTGVDGQETSLRYQVSADKVMLYFPADYIRAEGVPGEGLIGAWVGRESSGSTFIFRADRMFLEDGTFTGTFRVDPEAGTILLVYVGNFDDTLLYFRQEENDSLRIEYPWQMVAKQPAV